MIELSSVIMEEVGPRWIKPESETEADILLYVGSGQLTYRLNHQDIPLAKGDLLYIPKGTLRAGAGDEAHPHQKYAVFFEYENEAEFIPLLASKQHRLLHVRNYEYIKQRFSLLLQQWLGKLPHYETICQGIVLELLGLASREAETVDLPSKKLAMATAVQQYILENYRGQIRLEELARLVDKTPNYVTRIFREMTGQTPIDYLHQVRVYAAYDLLQNSTMSIGQVAEMLGYCDQSYFNRVYKKVTGHPPSSYLTGEDSRERRPS